MSTYLNAYCMNAKTGISSLPDRSQDLAILEIPKDFTTPSAMKLIKQCLRVAKTVVLFDFPRFGWFPINGSTLMFHIVDTEGAIARSIVVCSTDKGACRSMVVLPKEKLGKSQPLPIELYRRLLVEIKLDPAAKVLVPFSIDASALIALEAIGCEYTAYNTGIEYDQACNRLVKSRAQLSMFPAKGIASTQQTSIFDNP